MRKETVLYKNDEGNFTVVNGDIFGYEADVLVVPARRKPLSGKGLDKQVYERAGSGLNGARKKYLDIAELEVTEVFLERMGTKNAPENWSGIWTMTTK